DQSQNPTQQQQQQLPNQIPSDTKQTVLNLLEEIGDVFFKMGSVIRSLSETKNTSLKTGRSDRDIVKELFEVVLSDTFNQVDVPLLKRLSLLVSRPVSSMFFFDSSSHSNNNNEQQQQEETK